MITISITTIIAGAVVVLLAILGSLVNPFLRSLRFPETEGNETEGNVTEGNEESGNEAEFSQKKMLNQLQFSLQLMTTCRSWSEICRCFSTSSMQPTTRLS